MIRRIALGFTLIAALAACTSGSNTGGVVTTHVDYYSLYKPSLFYWVASGRDVPVVILGNPTQSPPDIWEQSVTRALNASTWVSAGNFTTTPNDSARGNFYFAFVFNAAPAMLDRTVCRGQIDTAQLAPADGRTPILGAFCNNDKPVTTARVTVNAITTPDAPQLQPAMDQLLIKMLPRQDPNRPDRVGDPFFLR